MKNITKTTAIFTALMGLSATASASDTARFVVSHEVAKTQVASAIQATSQGANETACLSAYGAGEWCLPLVNNQLKSSADSISNAKETTLISNSVALNTYGLEPEEVAKLLTRDGRFGIVEVDPFVTTPTPTVTANSYGDASAQSTNDPSSDYTGFYMGSASESPVGLGIYEAWDAVGYEKSDNPVDVVVLDSSFFENEDVPYFGGRNFSTTKLREDEGFQQRSDDYSPDELQVEEGLCTGHGLGVASVIGGTINNGIGSAGFTNDVNLHAIRTMSCGSGYFSDSIDAIKWVLKDDFRESENVTPYEGDVGIINMSLSARSETCPRFAQEVINRATEAGWTVVAAASNDYSDVTNYIPANCDNVVTIAALDRNADRAPFSNVGEEVDLALPGIDIAGSCTEENMDCYWDGTSFATPVATGMLAFLQSHSNLSNETLRLVLELSATTDVLGENCPENECGRGVPNLPAALGLAKSFENGELDTITFALEEGSQCENAWLINNFAGDIPLCSLYKVSFVGGFELAGAEFELLSKDKGADWSEGSVEGRYFSSVAYIEDINAEEKDYGYRICKGGKCSETPMSLDSEGALEENRPVECE
jgi:serine protease